MTEVSGLPLLQVSLAVAESSHSSLCRVVRVHVHL